ncbi:MULTISPECIES: SpaA isopeptide-forming pilin-related protein [unclassified Streptomyces]|uniref:SpaA isopeptide-forming pilin-related protein n=1 Tax=unclassified Streptomyces TaxID=2593676 RepID=UPI00332F1721
MHVCFVRSAAVTVAVAGTLIWAPAASAQPSQPAPSASAAPAETPVPTAGSVEITTRDAAGDLLPGATYLLLNSVGEEAGRGTTDLQGKVTFAGLAPGAYRLKETASGSPIHEAVADQDVIVTPGADTRLTITDPFTPATLTLTAKDSRSGKPLPGATFNIGTGDATLHTLTTGPNGTVSAILPVTSRTGVRYWAAQTKAPTGYLLHRSTNSFTAKPGEPVNVTVTDAKKPGATAPAPTSPTIPPGKPATETSAPGTSASDQDAGTSSPPASSNDPIAAETVPSTTDSTVNGELAHTGSDSTPWLLGGTGILLAAGGTAVLAARRRRIRDDSLNAQV